jgi:hypothetical protein
LYLGRDLLKFEFSQRKFPGVEKEVFSGSVSQQEPIGAVFEEEVEPDLGGAVIAVETFLAAFVRLSDRFDGVEGATDRTSSSVEGPCATVIEDPALQGWQKFSVFAQIDPKGSDCHVASNHPVEDVAQDLGFLLIHDVLLSGELPSLEDVVEDQGVDRVIGSGFG